MSDDKQSLYLLGEINGKMGSVLERLDNVEKELKSVVAMTNRWKGVTTTLIFIGGVLGWAVNFLFHGGVKS